MSATPNLNGGYPAVGKQPGRFFNIGDTRENLTKVVFDLDAKQCYTSSYDTATMSCQCCGQFLEKNGDRYGRQTYIIADQNFPAALPSDASGLKCLKILRIEGGSLDELAERFLQLHRGWQIIPGSIILIGSLSHLAAVGVAAYAEDLCAAVGKLAAGLNKAASVAPLPFVIAGDIEDPELIRGIVELYAWIGATLRSVEGTSTRAFETSLDGLRYNGGGKVQPDYNTRYRLPASFMDSSSRV